MLCNFERVSLRWRLFLNFPPESILYRSVFLLRIRSVYYTTPMNSARDPHFRVTEIRTFLCQIALEDVWIYLAESAQRKDMELERPPLRSSEATESLIQTLLSPEISSSSEPSNTADYEPESDSSNSDSGSEDKKITESEPYAFLGKRRRSQPVKFSSEFHFESKRTTPKRASFGKLRSTPRTRKQKASEFATLESKKKRGSRCRKCEGCLREDCGQCHYCLDKPKFGGPGKKKQRCALRTCSAFERKTPKKASDGTPPSDTSPVIEAKSPPSTTEELPSTDTSASKTTSKAAAASSSTTTTTTTVTSSTPISKEGSTPVTPVLNLVSVKQALASNQLSYAKAAMQLASNKLLISEQLKSAQKSKLSSINDTPVTSSPSKTGSSSSLTSGIPVVKPVASSGSATPSIIKKSPSQVVAKSVVATKVTAPVTPAKISSPVPGMGAYSGQILIKKSLSTPQVVTPKVTAAKGTVTIGITTPTISASSTVAAKKTTPVVATSVASKSLLNESGGPKNGKKNSSMICVQCGRERTMGRARNSKFCTQRCIINWVEAHPGKAPKEAELELPPEEETSSQPSKPTTPPSSGKDTPKSLPRALKNLQIDMAKPGTKLSEKDSDSAKVPGPTITKLLSSTETPSSSLVKTNAAMRANLIESLATMITEHQKVLQNASTLLSPASATAATTTTTTTTMATKISSSTQSGLAEKKVTQSSTAQGSKVTPKGPVKRTTTAQQPSSTKKQRVSAKASAAAAAQKSVTFDLDSTESIENKSTSPPGGIKFPLDELASYLQGRPKPFDVTKIKIPPGLPADIRQWTVANVVEYFKSTNDCQGYVDLFEAQEVDGIALLLLTHEALVKCLGIKLGRAVKIMNRVYKLKSYHEHCSKK